MAVGLVVAILAAVAIAPGRGFTCANCFCDVGFVDCKGRGLRRVSEIGLSGNVNVVEHVDLSNNHLQHLDELALSSLTRATALNLAGNNISVIDDHDLEGLVSVTNLDLSRNGMRMIGPGAFSRTPRLATLSLWSNKLQRIDFFGGCTLTALDASFNSVGNIDEASFQKCTRLNELVLAYNKIPNTDFVTHMYNCALRALDVGYNNIVDFRGDTLSKCTNLTSLDLSGNKIRSVDLSGLPSLRKLFLSDSNISQDVLPSFSSTPMLEWLLLSGNRITYVSADTFRNLPNLNVLSLAHNQLATIPDNTFLDCPSLGLVFLAHNKITDIGEGVFSVSVRGDYDTANVNPQECNQSTYGSASSSISYLDLSHNKMRRLCPQVFSSLRWAELRLDHNRLGTFGPDLVCVMEQRDLTVALEGNPLVCACGEMYDAFSLSKRLNVTLDVSCDWSSIDCNVPVLNTSNEQPFRSVTILLAYAIAISCALMSVAFVVFTFKVKKTNQETGLGYFLMKR